jgi:hypothetical protein
MSQGRHTCPPQRRATHQHLAEPSRQLARAHADLRLESAPAVAGSHRALSPPQPRSRDAAAAAAAYTKCSPSEEADPVTSRGLRQVSSRRLRSSLVSVGTGHCQGLRQAGRSVCVWEGGGGHEAAAGPKAGGRGLRGRCRAKGGSRQARVRRHEAAGPRATHSRPMTSSKFLLSPLW